MSSCRRSVLVSAALTVAAIALQPAAATAQKGKQPDPDGAGPKVGVTIALQVGSGRYDFTGQGVCLEILDGGILEDAAALYSVRQHAGKLQLNMTVYRLKKGDDLLTLNVTPGKATYSVSTVKAGDKGITLGSGTAKLDLANGGGTVAIDATDQTGVKIVGTVKCEAFTKPVQNNGL